MMREGKYYDWSRRLVLTPDLGCDYAHWPSRFGQSVFAVHPKGYPIFVPPSAISDADEYAASDPYSVEANLDSAFHRRRFASTIELVMAAARGLSPQVKLLDIGCGEGHLTAAIAERLAQAEVSAFDYSLSAIDKAVDLYPGIDFAVADAYDPPYAPDYFDVVVCNNLWEHVGDPLRLLSAIRRITRSGGYLVLSTPSRYRTTNLFRVLRGKRVSLMSPLHVTEYSVGQVIEQLRHGGYEIKRVGSSPRAEPAKGLKDLVLHRLMEPLLRTWLRLVGSHHSIESTVFFLAEKIEPGGQSVPETQPEGGLPRS